MQIPFNIPVDADAEWAILENIIRTILSERDAQTALQDEVVARMQQVWVDHQFSHTVTIPDDEQGQGPCNQTDLWTLVTGSRTGASQGLELRPVLRLHFLARMLSPALTPAD